MAVDDVKNLEVTFDDWHKNFVGSVRDSENNSRVGNKIQRQQKKQKKRIFENHLSIEQEKILNEIDLSAWKKIYLIHISKRYGNAEKFKSQVENLLKELGHKNIKVFVAE